MPELPEIETIRSNMQEHRGARIMAVQLMRDDILRQRDYEPNRLVGQTLSAFRRRGKYLIIEVGDKYYLIIHLGMSGRFYALAEAEAHDLPHVHFIIHLDREQKLIYQDPRRFGGIWLCREDTQLFQKMGPEPLSAEFTRSYLQRVLNRSQSAVKNVLLNQQHIAGLGNIYVDEALFASGIRPDRPAASLREDELKHLHRAIRTVLRSGIEQRGTSFRDYRDGFNRPGDFQNYLRVYGKEGQPCPRCGHLITKIVIGGRGTHFCEHCQS